jgi:hypothetical protein
LAGVDVVEVVGFVIARCGSSCGHVGDIPLVAALLRSFAHAHRFRAGSRQDQIRLVGG